MVRLKMHQSRQVGVSLRGLAARRGRGVSLASLSSFRAGHPGNVSQPADGLLSVGGMLAISSIVLAWVSIGFKWLNTSVVSAGQKSDLFSLTLDEPRSARLMRLLAFALFIGAGVFGALLRRRARLPRMVSIPLVILIGASVWWTLFGYEPSQYVDALLGTWNPMGFTMCFGVFAGLDRSLWRWLRPVALWLAYGSVALGWYYAVRFSSIESFAGANPMVEYLQLAFWLTWCALVLTQTAGWRAFVPALIPMALCLPLAIMISSRSFTALASVGFAVGIFFAMRGSLRRARFRLIAVILCTGVVVVGFLCALSLAAPTRLEAFQNRMLEDSRTSQYSEFFRQIPVSSLIPGRGPKASYTYGEFANYEYIDNQFLFIAFKLGLAVLLGYCAVVLWPGLSQLFRGGNRPQQMIGVLFVFWTFASLGLSIFHGILPNPQNFLIILLAGRSIDLAAAPRPASPVFHRSLSRLDALVTVRRFPGALR